MVDDDAGAGRAELRLRGMVLGTPDPVALGGGLRPPAEPGPPLGAAAEPHFCGAAVVLRPPSLTLLQPEIEPESGASLN